MNTSQETIYDILLYYVDPNTSPKKRSIDKLDKWAEEIVNNDDQSLERGLSGLGWIVSYLIQHKYIKADVEEIIGDIDDILYKYTLKEITTSEMNISQLLGYITYYQQRILHMHKSSFYRRFTHLECMKLLLQKLNGFLLKDSISPTNLNQKINIVLKYSFLIKTGLDERQIEESFYSTIEELIHYFSFDNTNGNNLNMLCKLYGAIKQYENYHWSSQIEKLLPPKQPQGKHWEALVYSFISKEKINWQNYLNGLSADEKGFFLFECITNIKGFSINE